MRERTAFHRLIAIGFWLMVSGLIVGRIAYYDRIVSADLRDRVTTIPTVTTSAAQARYGS